MKTVTKIIISLFIGFTPALAFADTSADLSAQAQALLAQVAALEAQLAAQSGGAASANVNTNVNVNTANGVITSGSSGTAATVDSSACPNIGRSLKKGSSGADVSRLQQFLAQDPSIYPEATVSGYFGALTEAAVKRWQVKYNVVSSGTPATTGFGMVGPRTAAAIALLCSTRSQQQGSTVGGYIQVSPISGAAPLTVTVTANVNSTLSCTGAIYTLDFGDSTPVQQIPVSANACKEFAQTFSHIYQYGGTYNITLSANGHATNAQVVVTGNPKPTTPAAQDSVRASVTSGQAPLVVTFSGTINGAQSCNGGTYTLVLGDGTSVPLSFDSSSCASRSYTVTHQYTTAGTMNVQLFAGAATAGNAVAATSVLVAAGTVAATTTSPTGTPTYVYGTPTLSQNAGNQLSFSMGFDLPSACTGYSLSWGDGSSDVVQADASGSCAAQQAARTLTHLYSGSGSYTISLKRGPTLARVDSASITISN